MSEKPDDPEQPAERNPAPLDYERPSVRSSGSMQGLGLVAGLIIGFGFVAFFGAGWYLGLYPIDRQNAKVNWPSVVALFAIGAAAIAGTILHGRRRRTSGSSWLLLGLLISVGIACLIEGVCFMRP